MTTSNKTKAIIVDLDGTLCDCSHRRPFLLEERPDWRSFNESMRTDGLNTWCLELINAMRAAGYKIVLVSGRGDDYRDLTVDWLNLHDINYDELLMRRAGDSRKDALVKMDIFKSAIEPVYDICFVVDDRKQVIEMWRKDLGLVCLQCAEGDY
jgi:predicted secreted acid phosphatase